jgi:hypothetical protein
MQDNKLCEKCLLPMKSIWDFYTAQYLFKCIICNKFKAISHEMVFSPDGNIEYIKKD